jgi:hypothetical protein
MLVMALKMKWGFICERSNFCSSSILAFSVLILFWRMSKNAIAAIRTALNLTNPKIKYRCFGVFAGFEFHFFAPSASISFSFFSLWYLASNSVYLLGFFFAKKRIPQTYTTLSRYLTATA